MHTKDIFIIGGGICGMTAAIYAARANLSVGIIEKDVCGGLVNWTHVVENVPSYQSVHGMELMEKCRDHVAALGIGINEVEEVTGVDLAGDIKRIYTSDEEYASGAVIIATGRRPIPLPVETDFEKVHYCSVCDGPPYKGKDIIVVGGGNSGFDEALYLAGLGVKSVHIVEFMPLCAAATSTQKKATGTGSIRVSTSTKLISVSAMPDGRAEACLENAQTGDKVFEQVDGIFCFIGQSPNSGIFQSILNTERGYIKVTADMETNIPGVFAAGDITVKKYRQITTAMGDGTIAALQAERYLRGKA